MPKKTARLMIDIVVFLDLLSHCLVFKIGHAIYRYLKSRLCGF